MEIDIRWDFKSLDNFRFCEEVALEQSIAGFFRQIILFFRLYFFGKELIWGYCFNNFLNF